MKRWRAAATMLLALCSGAALGTTSSTVTEGTYSLRQGNTNVQTGLPTLQACIDAAEARSESQRTSRTYNCDRTADRVTVTYTAPAPQPVNCAVSAWGSWTGGAWGACTDGTQSRTETRSRTITTQPANGGQACPVLTETRTATQTCTVAPPPPPPPSGVVGSYENGPTAITLTGTFARYPGSAVAPFGALTGTSYANDPRMVNGSRSGIYTTSAFSLAVNCSEACSVKLYVGGWNSSGRLTAGAYTHTTTQASGQWNAVYTLHLHGSTTVSWARAAGAGNVTIQAAELLGPAPPPPPPAVGTASMEWNAPALYADGSPIDKPLMYRIEYGRGDFTRSAQTAETTAEVIELESGQWQFRVRAGIGGLFGEPSDTDTKTIP